MADAGKPTKSNALTLRGGAGAQARWAKADPSREQLPRAICGSTDKPLKIGGMSIPCYVLEDETRVLTVAGLSDAIGLARGGSMVPGMNRLELFVSRKGIKTFVTSDLSERIGSPIVFLTPTGGKAYGYDADVLVELCEAVLALRESGDLQEQQKRIAQYCEKLVRGLARAGIAAMVDEATGYQYIRRRDALHAILDEYMSRDLLPWTKKFPDEFYIELYRLMKWDYLNPLSAKKPGYVGKLTNLLIYDRLPPGVLDELRRQNPVKDATKRRAFKHHQLLSTDIGNPHLEKQITKTLALMEISDSWRDFIPLFRKRNNRVKARDNVTSDRKDKSASQLTLAGFDDE